MKNLAYLQSLKGMNLLIWLERKSTSETINSYTIYNCYSDMTYSVLATTTHQYFIHISEPRKMRKIWNFSKSYIYEFLGIDF